MGPDERQPWFHREKRWYPWDGTLNNQPHIHLIVGVYMYLLGNAPLKGLMREVPQFKARN